VIEWGWVTVVGSFLTAFAFWESAVGHGGPSFPPDLLGRLASLHLELNLDMYCDSSEDDR